MLDSLITSKTRMKLLLKFFSNSQTRAYLRGLAHELGESTNAVRVELNRLSEVGLLEHEQDGNTVLYKANTRNPFFRELHRLVMKYMGVDDVVENVVKQAGDIELAFINGDYARGLDTGIIDLVLVGKYFDMDYLGMLHRRGQEISGRKIRLLTLNPQEFTTLLPTLDINSALVLWATEKSGYTAAQAYR
jgi:Mn-dependent DtxR family transcriptional regulator